MKSPSLLSLTGFVLIAVTYGMARFAWGLMMPQASQEIAFSAQASGVIAACSYLAYCLATASATGLINRFGARWTAMFAALCAATGLLILAMATSAVAAAGGLFIAGLSAGFASPALACAVESSVDAARQTGANTFINAGTSAGIIFSVPLLMLMPGGWRTACISFALFALACLYPARRFLLASPGIAHASALRWRDHVQNPALRRIVLIAFISGAASAAWWCFGPDILRNNNHLDHAATSMLWLISGGAGILGAFTSPLARRIGIKRVYYLTQLAMAVPLLLLAANHHFTWWLVPAAALCGAGYVTLSGILLVFGAKATEASPATGVAAAFFMLAAGQIVGAILFGQLYASISTPWVLSVFAALSLIMLAVLPESHSATAR